MRPPLHRDAGSIAKARDYPKGAEESNFCCGARHLSKLGLEMNANLRCGGPRAARQKVEGAIEGLMTDRTSSSVKMPEQCETMVDVRAGVDQVDRELVALLVRRFGYMDAAARIKPDRSAVRDEDRKTEVIDNAGREAAALGLEEARIRAVWDELVEQSIAYELSRWDATRS
jgi:isochorismate pyruvate lyase